MVKYKYTIVSSKDGVIATTESPDKVDDVLDDVLQRKDICEFAIISVPNKIYEVWMWVLDGSDDRLVSKQFFGDIAAMRKAIWDFMDNEPRPTLVQVFTRKNKPGRLGKSGRLPPPSVDGGSEGGS